MRDERTAIHTYIHTYIYIYIHRSDLRLSPLLATDLSLSPLPLNSPLTLKLSSLTLKLSLLTLDSLSSP